MGEGIEKSAVRRRTMKSHGKRKKSKVTFKTHRKHKAAELKQFEKIYRERFFI